MTTPQQEEGLVAVRPQPGPQEAFLSSNADIAIFGGSAFSGKTFALLLEPLRSINLPRFSAVIFRRETTQVRNPGGLWDESRLLYAPFGARPLESVLEHRFPFGAVVKFAHLEHEDSVQAWDGAQVPLLGFDQLEHFSKGQFFYMLSRNRDPSGRVHPYVRATCNPDPDSWLASFISWWIDQNTGYPIAARSGVLRWFVREGDEIVWADSRAALLRSHGKDAFPLSVTFIPGRIFDNKIGMSRDPSYLAKLKALNKVERERLLGGNWKIRPAAGLMFRREWCAMLEDVPEGVDWVRYWDLAATEVTATNTSPAWTVGVKLGRYRTSRRYVVGHVIRMQKSAAKVEEALRNTASTDGKGVRVGIPQDPGQAGKSQVQTLVRGALAGYPARSYLESGDKVTRFFPFSAQCEHGNVDMVRGVWNDAFFVSLESFPDGAVKDDADACSGALAMLLEHGGPVDMEGGVAVVGGEALGEGSPWGRSEEIAEASGAPDAPWNM